VELPVFELDETMIIYDFFNSNTYTILELDEAMVGADVELPVLENDETMELLFFELNNLPSLSLIKPWLELMWSSQFLRMMKPWSYCSLN
jgi:hypothetical protein